MYAQNAESRVDFARLPLNMLTGGNCPAVTILPVSLVDSVSTFNFSFYRKTICCRLYAVNTTATPYSIQYYSLHIVYKRGDKKRQKYCSIRLQ